MMDAAWALILASALTGADNLAGADARRAGEEIEVPSVLIKLIEQVDVPAREAGVLASVNVREGQPVEQGDLLAQIVDTEAQIAEKRAAIELEIARKNAKNDVNIRFAKKSTEVAKAELRRAEESIDQYSKSISDSEMDRLRLVVERSVLEEEQAEYERQIAAYTLQIKENEHLAAEEKVRRRRIVAPLDGVVVDVQRFRGEWVQPGDAVLRILRMDRLRAEGFVSVEALRHDLMDCSVRLEVDLPDETGASFPGKIVFLSPEIDPVNAEVRVWAEIENRGLRLRPGMRAKMIIELPVVSPEEPEPVPLEPPE